MGRIDRMDSRKTRAIRCEHDGLKMAEVKAGCLILRQRHHGEMHVQVVPLGELVEHHGTGGSTSASNPR